MTEYDNTNRGALWKNDRRTTPNHPDYKGEININGTVHWLSAWLKDGKKGKFLSLAIGGEKEVQPGGGARNRVSNTPDLDDESVPF